MHIGNTSVLEFVSRTRSGRCATFARVGLAAAIACAPVAGLLAQGTQTSRSQKTPPDTQRQVTTARLIVPVTGTLGTTSAPTTAATDPVTTQAAPVATPILAPTTTATGSFSIQRFTRTTDDSLAAFGTLTLSFTDPTSNTPRTIVTQSIVPLTKSGSGATAVAPVNQAQPITPVNQAQPITPVNQAQPIRATTQPAAATQECETLSLVLSPLQLDLLGVSIQLKETNLDFTVMPGTSGQLGSQLCDVGKQFDSGAIPSEIMKTLNTLLETVG
jgi:hypothetical protein